MKQAGRAQGALQTVTAASPAADLIAYYGGPASDVYFQRARTTLAGARVDAVVAMDFFSSKAGVLCGVAEAVRLLSGILQEGDQAWAVAEGAAMEKKETVLRVHAPYSRFGVYETALLGMLSSCSGWATAAREIVEAAGGKRVISFGARHVHPLIAPTMEYSAVVGGCAGCATPLGAQLAGLQGASGTMPHAMILLFGDPVKEVRARLDQAGFSHVGIFVSGGLDAARIREFEAAKCPIHSYGVGMAISSAPPIAFTADIKEIAGKPVTKRGRIPGIAPNPRLARVI